MNNHLFTSLSDFRNRHLFLVDSLIFLGMPLWALVFRCLDFCPDFNLYLSQIAIISFIFLLTKIQVLFSFGFYKRYWQYASTDELVYIATLMGIATILQTLIFHGIRFLFDSDFDLLPRSLPVVEGVLSFLGVGAVRFGIRISKQMKQRSGYSRIGDRVLIVGAGSAGLSLLQTIQHDQKLAFVPIGFIDDHPRKQGIQLRGLPVLGTRHQLFDLIPLHQIDTVLIAMPCASGAVIREVVGICQQLGVKTKTLPSLAEILDRNVRLENLREVKIEDLLRRDPIQTDFQRISTFLKGRRVLVTGAGGSIGSELCRQILRCEPDEILLLGHGENSIFLIHQELTQVLETWQRQGKITQKPQVKTAIADVRSYERLHAVFSEFRPDVVFHAAAHKHVPLMEMNPAEAVTNNILGTRNLVEVALQLEINHLVMISTDKAVNPTSIMGATKRVAEMLVLRAAHNAKRAYVVVRFGNVLGSRGSVIPTFLRQIAAGGPLTITHPDICRFFMTIPEAVQLVLQSSVLGSGGEVFTLDMGQPLRILNLAQDLIRLSGYEVDRDIQIAFTGLRPGEKLYEELFIEGEDYHRTQHEKILIAQNASHFVSPELDATVQTLMQAAEQNDIGSIKALLQRLIPEYTPLVPDTQFPTTPVLTSSRTQVANTTLRTQHQLHPVATPSIFKDSTLKSMEGGLTLQSLQVHYQPILRLKSQEVVGFEALLRCEHPQKGFLLAQECLDIAQEYDQMPTIGSWMLDQVCAQMADWQQHYLKTQSSFQVSLNLSQQEFYHPQLLASVQRALDTAPLHPHNLHMEIPGFVVLEEPEHAAKIVIQLKRLGLKVNLDNCRDRDLRSPQWLAWVKRLRTSIDQLKLDRSLVQRLESDRHQDSIQSLQTLQTTAELLGADLVAVGVDRPQQLAYLEAVQCQYAQGFWFSAPVNDQRANLFLQPGTENRITA